MPFRFATTLIVAGVTNSVEELPPPTGLNLNFGLPILPCCTSLISCRPLMGHSLPSAVRTPASPFGFMFAKVGAKWPCIFLTLFRSLAVCRRTTVPFFSFAVEIFGVSLKFFWFSCHLILPTPSSVSRELALLCVS